MNRDIGGEIYNYLTLEEKMRIKDIGDPLLYIVITDEVDRIWICPNMKGELEGTEEEVLWTIFQDDTSLRFMLNSHHKKIMIRESLGIARCWICDNRNELRIVRETILRCGKEKIIGKMKKFKENGWLKVRKLIE